MTNTPISDIMNLWGNIVNFASQVIKFFNYQVDLGFVNKIPDWLIAFVSPALAILPDHPFTVGELILGELLYVFLALTIAKWLIGIVT